MKFTKMTGTGNDYIYIESDEKNDFSSLSKKLSNRNFGIGADGLVIISKSKKADAFMRMFNSDGTEGTMCGNAIRCVAKYLFDNEYITSNIATIETISGIKSVKIEKNEDNETYVSVNMGKVSFLAKDCKINTEKIDFFDEEIEVLGKKYNAFTASVGNPHLVIFNDDIQMLDLANDGKHFENHELFLDRVNTEFIKVESENSLSMRVYERGSGETLSCGTGACASVAVCVRKGIFKFNEFITVNVLGGKLYIKILDDYTVILKGSATTVFTGEI